MAFTVDEQYTDMGFGKKWQVDLYQESTRIASYGAGLEVDWTQVVSAIRNMTSKEARKFVGNILRTAGRKHIKKPVQEEIKQRYPGGKTYPRNKGRKSGWFKGKQYGPLWKDVKMSVYKNRNGVNVSLFSPKKGQNRWCVAMWLNDGTNERGNERSKYKYHSGSKTRSFLNASGRMSRGRIVPTHYFENIARAGLATAAESVPQDISRILAEKFNQK